MTTDSNLAKKIKIRFQIQPSQGVPYAVETIWAEHEGEGRYRLLNIPFFVFDVSAGDIVETKEADGEIRDFSRVAKRGGHSTYRLYLQGGRNVRDPDFARLWSQILSLGGSYENANDRLVAVDLPPDSNVSEIYRIFEAGQEEGVWAFEEAHFCPKMN